ncbi:MAG: tellurite resistance/C4-dicarboxylate transporter family protein [Streptosporangiaceae bacterium]
MRRILDRLAERLPADSFSVVMATGIVSIAAHDDGHPVLSDVFGVIAAAIFVGLVVLVADRLRRRELMEDPRDLTEVFGLYTFVAGCGVLDARLGHRPGGLVAGIGVVQLLTWLSLVPTVWGALRRTPVARLRGQARGSWLLATVGTQSLAITAVDVSSAGATRPLLGAAIIWWVLGVAAYLATAALIVWRLLSAHVSPEEVTPDSWILMGALAISTLAGGKLVLAAGRPGAFPWLGAVMPEATLAVWALGSAWIPLLAAGEWWRLRRMGRAAVRYTRARWAMVFPLGMYASANYTVAKGIQGEEELAIVSHVFFWVALLAWCAAAYGLGRLGWRVAGLASARADQ